MKFTPKSKEELKAEQGILAEGEADFEIMKATDEKSKSSGADMIKLQIKVWDKNGKSTSVFDYITEGAHWKLLNLLVSIGKPSFYDTGEVLAQHLVGGSGKLELKLQSDKKYGDRMIVKDYYSSSGDIIKTKSDSKKSDSEPPDFNEDEDVPF